VRDLAVVARLLGPRWSIEKMYAGLNRAERFVTGNSTGRSLDGEMTVGRYSPGQRSMYLRISDAHSYAGKHEAATASERLNVA
jgi:hypothetical protein